MPIILPDTASIQTNVTRHEDKVVLQFDRPITEVAYDIEGATIIARAVSEYVKEIAIMKGLIVDKDKGTVQ